MYAEYLYKQITQCQLIVFKGILVVGQVFSSTLCLEVGSSNGRVTRESKYYDDDFLFVGKINCILLMYLFFSIYSTRFLEMHFALFF